MIMSLKQRKLKFKPRIKLNHNIDTESASTEIFKGFQIVGRHRKQCRKTSRKDLATELSLFRCCAVFEHLDMPDMPVSAN